jgi:hypothetical protein
LVKIIPIVMLVLALLLAIVLRSLVAPLYLVASVGLSYLASLGLAVLVFVIIGGQDGINFVLPFFMFVFIMALGQDYNILVMTRIREEAHHAPIRVAVRRAVEATGTTVTSAGLILAGTFGVLTATGNTQVKEIGLGLAAGILVAVQALPRGPQPRSGGSRMGRDRSRRRHRPARAAGRHPGGAGCRSTHGGHLALNARDLSGAVGAAPGQSTVNRRGQPTEPPHQTHGDPPGPPRQDTDHRQGAPGPRPRPAPL